MQPVPDIERELERRVEALGFELVDVRWAGSRSRPILRVRIDRPDGPVTGGVSVGDCATVSRGLEPWLDGHEAVPFCWCMGWAWRSPASGRQAARRVEPFPPRYVLEVSSPGVDRPLLRERDFRRFEGERVAVKGHEVLAGRSRRLEGELLGLEEGEGGPAVRLRLPDGDEVRIPREEIAGANLVFTWK